jgi:hypothetical protein
MRQCGKAAVRTSAALVPDTVHTAPTADGTRKLSAAQKVSTSLALRDKRVLQDSCPHALARGAGEENGKVRARVPLCAGLPDLPPPIDGHPSLVRSASG